MTKSKEEMFVDAIINQHSKEMAYRLSHPDYKGKNAKHLGNVFYKREATQLLLQKSNICNFGMIASQVPRQLTKTMQKIDEVLERTDLTPRDIVSLQKSVLEVADRVGLSSSKVTEIKQTIKHEASVEDATAQLEKLFEENPAARGLLARPVEATVIDEDTGGKSESDGGGSEATNE